MRVEVFNIVNFSAVRVKWDQSEIGTRVVRAFVMWIRE
jgi:hypothetical protein